MMSIMPLMTIEPNASTHGQGNDGWEKVDFAVDPSASETVLPTHLLADIKTQPSDASKRGVLYEVANGERIPNLGEKLFDGETHCEGIKRRIRAQVCDVSKPLLSVAKLVKAGNSVVFTPEGSYVHDPMTGEYMTLQEESGMYTLGLWVKKEAGADSGF